MKIDKTELIAYISEYFATIDSALYDEKQFKELYGISSYNLNRCTTSDMKIYECFFFSILYKLKIDNITRGEEVASIVEELFLFALKKLAESRDLNKSLENFTKLFSIADRTMKKMSTKIFSIENISIPSALYINYLIVHSLYFLKVYRKGYERKLELIFEKTLK
jgi:hypothetical protein